MAKTLYLYQSFRIDVGGEDKEAGSRDTPKEISLDGEFFECRKVVADDYNVETLWTTGDGGLATFDFLWFETDADVLLELRNDDTTDEFAVIEVKAGVPFVLAADDLLANDAGASDLTDGAQTAAADIDQIDRIAVQNNVANDAGDATVRLILIK